MQDFSRAKYPSTYTKDQIIAEQMINKWYYTSNDIEFTLKGWAGTGKTFLINHFLNDFKYRVCVTAPTHKAVRVVEQMTGRKGKTLHSLHGLRPNFALDAFNLNNVKFAALGVQHMRYYDLIIIDECSQINKDLYELNRVRAKQFGVKILYIGDPCQLPPVKEDISKAFLVKNQYELKEIIRQEAGNPLIDILDIARQDVVNGTSNLISYLRKNRGIMNDKEEGYVVLGAADFADAITNYFSSDKFVENINYARFTAWTNDTILKGNKFIRRIVVGDNKPIIDIDDLFIGYKTIINEFNNTTLINSEDYIVEGDPIYRQSEHGFNCYELRFKSMSDGNIFPIRIVDHTSDTLKVFHQILCKLHTKAIIKKAGYWKLFYNFKNSYCLLTKIPIMDSTGKITTYVNKDIDYGYGLTVHKLQGSTIENILINLEDILYYKINGKLTPVRDFKFRNKLIYTALSRASKRAIILLRK